MAKKNPRDQAARIAVHVPLEANLAVSPDAADFLRRTFGMVLDGIRADLAGYGHKLDDVLRLHREEAAYRALLIALDTGRIRVTEDIRRVLRELADSTDRANDYTRVVAEHAALLGLRKQIGEVVEE